MVCDKHSLQIVEEFQIWRIYYPLLNIAIGIYLLKNTILINGIINIRIFIFNINIRICWRLAAHQKYETFKF